MIPGTWLGLLVGIGPAIHKVMTTQTKGKTMTNEKKELHEGVSGSGHTSYLVVTVRSNGSWKHTETFDNKAEALNWMRWS